MYFFRKNSAWPSTARKLNVRRFLENSADPQGVFSGLDPKSVSTRKKLLFRR
jgi:hypothetical protein